MRSSFRVVHFVNPNTCRTLHMYKVIVLYFMSCIVTSVISVNAE